MFYLCVQFTKDMTFRQKIMKTKKTWMLAAILFCCLTSAQAQYYNTRHELGLAIGSGSNTEIINSFADLYSVAVSAAVTNSITGGTITGYYTYGEEKYIPTISVEYYYHVNKLIGLGGFLAFNGLKRDMYVNWKSNSTGAISKEKTGEATRYNYTIMPTAKFDWLRKKHVGLYSKAGVGLTFMNERQEDDAKDGTKFSKTDANLNFHLTFIGFEGGSENWRGFAELGFGEQGIILAGLKYKF